MCGAVAQRSAVQGELADLVSVRGRAATGAPNYALETAFRIEKHDDSRLLFETEVRACFLLWPGGCLSTQGGRAPGRVSHVSSTRFRNRIKYPKVSDMAVKQQVASLSDLKVAPRHRTQSAA